MIQKLLPVLLLLVLTTGSAFPSDKYTGKVLEHGGGCKWSPSGKLLAYVQGFTLAIWDPAADTTAHYENVLRYEYAWLNDSQLVTFERSSEKNTFPWTRHATLTFMTLGNIVEGIYPDSQMYYTSKCISNIGFRSHPSGTVALKMFDTLVSIVVSPYHMGAGEAQPAFAFSHYPPIISNNRPIREDTDIWLLGADCTSMRRLTDGGEYVGVKVSPDGARTACVNVAGDLLILDSIGKVQVNLGDGSFDSWSHDGKHIVFARTIQGDMTYVASDLYLYSLETDSIERLTNTPDMIELKPVASTNARIIVYNSIDNSSKGKTLRALIKKGE